MNGPATLLTLFLMMVASDAHAAAPAVCNVTRASFDAHMAIAKHPQIGVLDKKLVQPFIAYLNKVPPVTHLYGDAIVTYESPSPESLRAAFFLKGCLVDDLFIPKQAFIGMLMEVIKKRTDI